MKIEKECETKLNGVIWFPASNDNFLCQQIEDKIMCIDVLPDADKKINLYNAIYGFGEKLFLIPWRARQILVYDTHSSNYIILENNELMFLREIDQKYASSFLYENYLYLFGRFIPYVVKIDMRTNELKLLDELYIGKVRKLLGQNQYMNLFFSSSYVVYEDTVLMPMLGVKGIMELRLCDDTMVFWELPIGTGAICRAEKDFVWIVSGSHNCLVKWSKKKGIVNTFGPIDLQSICGEVALEYNNDVVRCKSEIECVCINVKTGQRTTEAIQKNMATAMCGGCTDDFIYKYFNLMKDKVFWEDNSGYQRSIYMYLRYIMRMDIDHVERVECGKCIGENIFSIINA